MADPRFSGFYEYHRPSDTPVPPRRLLIDDPEDKGALAPTKLIFDDPDLLKPQHPIEAMEKIRLAQLQDTNLVPLIKHLRDGSIPY